MPKFPTSCLRLGALASHSRPIVSHHPDCDLTHLMPLVDSLSTFTWNNVLQSLSLAVTAAYRMSPSTMNSTRQLKPIPIPMTIADTYYLILEKIHIKGDGFILTRMDMDILRMDQGCSS